MKLTDTIILKNANHAFLQKGFYFNSLLYRLQHITLNKFNYGNK